MSRPEVFQTIFVPTAPRIQAEGFHPTSVGVEVLEGLGYALFLAWIGLVIREGSKPLE